jgi:hypothetical protein
MNHQKEYDEETSNVDYDSRDENCNKYLILDNNRQIRRRSKNDNDGRSHKCVSCGKAYLSYPALYTHIKTKHETQLSNSGKGRGRPKKDIGVSIIYNIIE